MLQELRNLNLAAYKRILELLKDETKSFIFFPNEVSSSTTIKRSLNETINDSNDRAIREAALYFSSALNDIGEVLLLSNDRENQVRAKEAGLTALTMRAYVELFLDQYPDLLGLVAHTSIDSDARFNPLIFYLLLPI